MNWQAVIDSLRHDSRKWQDAAKLLNDDTAALVLNNAMLARALADALQMGLNKRGES